MISKASSGRIRHAFFPAVVCAGFACMPVFEGASAQSASDLLSKVTQGLSGNSLSNGSTITQDTTPQQTMLMPDALTPDQQAEILQPSDLEKLYTERAGQTLKLFGYDQFGQGRPVVLTQVGGVQSNYILGVGDEIVVSLLGQQNTSYRLQVNRSGQVILPGMSPVSAAGRTFGDFSADMQNAIRHAFVSTKAFISVGQVRQLNVLVSGQVHTPGMRSLNGLSTVVDAIALSGGIRKDGSLRNVEIQRGGRTLHVDLYSVLAGQGSSANLSLRDGDRIVVPSLGNTFAVTGDMHRKGIFELPSGSSQISLRSAVSLAGNALVSGVYRISLLRRDASGQMKLVDVTDQENAVVKAGEVVVVKLVSDIALNQVSLRGAVLSPGVFSLKKYRTLHDMMPSADVFAHDAYMLFGYIDRINHISHQHELVPFSPKHIVEGSDNISLQNDDRVVIFSREDMQNTVRDAMSRIKSRNTFNTTGQSDQQSQFQQQRYAPQLFNNKSTGEDLGYHGQVPKPTQMIPGMGGQTALPAGMTPQQYQQYQQQQMMSQSSGAPAQQYAAGTQASGMQGTANPYAQTNPAQTMMAGGAAGNSALAASQAGNMQSTASGTQTSQDPTLQMQNQTLAGAQLNATQSQFNLGDVQQSGEFTEPPMSLEDRLDQMAVYYRANVGGAVEDPGVYLVAPGTTLAEAIVAAGGLRPDVDRSNVEVTSTVIDNNTGSARTSRKNYSIVKSGVASKIRLEARDDVVFRVVYTNRASGTVTILGQVRYPGTYNILRGERLSSVLMRAGGLTSTAYPYGTVFLRKSIAQMETSARQREAKQLEDMLIVAMTRVSTDSQMEATSFTALQGYINQLKVEPGLGRMTVTADPAKLAANPKNDPVMEAGDKVIIPERPYTVSVMGEVLQPTSVPYKQDRSASGYIKMAGGFSQMADDDEVFVVLPNGSAYRADRGWFSFGSRDIPPGSSVYVGRDISGYDLRQGVIDVTKIFSQMATSLAAIAAISND